MVARRDLVCALTGALPQGAPAQVVERMAGALLDAAGPCTAGSARHEGADAAPLSEQRWSAAAVAGSYRRRPDLVDRAWWVPDRAPGDRAVIDIPDRSAPVERGERARDAGLGAVRRGRTEPESADEWSGWDRSAGIVLR